MFEVTVAYDCEFQQDFYGVNNNLRASNIRVSNRTLIYNVCPKSALT